MKVLLAAYSRELARDFCTDTGTVQYCTVFHDAVQLAGQRQVSLVQYSSVPRIRSGCGPVPPPGKRTGFGAAW